MLLRNSSTDALYADACKTCNIRFNLGSSSKVPQISITDCIIKTLRRVYLFRESFLPLLLTQLPVVYLICEKLP